MRKRNNKKVVRDAEVEEQEIYINSKVIMQGGKSFTNIKIKC